MSKSDHSSKRWYVIYTKPFQEDLAEVNLKRQGYEVYYPRIEQDCLRRGRWTSIIAPLFPRYLFVKMEQGKDEFTPIRSTYGVSDLVRFGGMPKSVSDALIMAIKSREDKEKGLHVICNEWKSGMAIEVTKGPFSGLKGIFLSKSAEERVIILLHLLGRESSVMVTQNFVVPV